MSGSRNNPNQANFLSITGVSIFPLAPAPVAPQNQAFEAKVVQVGNGGNVEEFKMPELENAEVVIARPTNG